MKLKEVGLILLLLISGASFADVDLAGLKFKNIESEFVHFDGKSVISINEFNKNSPVQVSLGQVLGATKCVLNARVVSCAGSSESVLMIDSEPRVFTFEVIRGKVRKEFKIKVLPEDFPRFKITGESASKKDLLISPQPQVQDSTTGHLLKLSHDGKILFYRKLPMAIADLRSHLVQGRTFYSYSEIDEEIKDRTYLGRRVILDDQFRFVKRFPQRLDFHEFQLVDLDHFYALISSYSRTKTGLVYLNGRFVEIKNGNEVFSWGVSELIDQGFIPAMTYSKIDSHGQVYAHLYHLNSFQLLPGGKVFIGTGTDGYLLLDRETRKVDWFFDGLSDQFGLTAKMKTSFTHTPILDLEKSSLLVFDNGLAGSQTRILKYKIDFSSKKVKSFDVLRQVPREFSFIMGGVEQLNAETIGICFGGKVSGEYDYVEMKNDKTIFTLQFLRYKNSNSFAKDIYVSKYKNQPPDWMPYRVYRP